MAKNKGEDSVRTRLEAAMACVVEMKTNHKMDGRSQMITKCPMCGGEVRMRIAASNKHTSGKCRTAGCIQWIE